MGKEKQKDTTVEASELVESAIAQAAAAAEAWGEVTIEEVSIEVAAVEVEEATVEETAAEEVSVEANQNEDVVAIEASASADEETASEDMTQESLELGDQEPQAEVELEFIDSFQLLSIVESLLFASDKPLSLAALKQVFQGTTVDTKKIKQTMDELMSIYADPTRGVALEEVNGGWQLRTKLDNMEFLKRIVKTRPFRLSGPALEVLSIIAYKQPLIKNEVDQIRGVESGHLVRALMDKGLVSFEGKTDLPGKPMAYSTTRKFLEIFGLRNLNELPSLSEIDQLLPDGIGEETEEKETLSDVTESMSNNTIAASYSEGEEELMDITNKLGSISTSSEFFEQEKVRQKQKRDREKAEDIREALTMGEVVDEKEVRWLERYEAQLAEEALAKAQAEAAALTQNAEVLEAAESNNEEAVVENVSNENTQELSSEEELEDIDRALGATAYGEDDEESEVESEIELSESNENKSTPEGDASL